MKVWKTVELFRNNGSESNQLEVELNELQKAGKDIVTVYPSAFNENGFLRGLTIVYIEEDIEEE